MIDQQPPSQPAEPASSPTAPQRSYFRKIFHSGGEYLFQFFMLFLAVTAGFFADNLREDFGERRQTELYAHSLQTDLARDTINLDYIKTILRSAIQNIDGLAGYVRGKKIEQLNNFELYRLTRFYPAPAFRWSRATLQQIKSSGSLRHFVNEDISTAISYYDALSIHLDQDNFEDQQRFHDATEAANHVIDLSYPADVREALEKEQQPSAETMNSLSLVTSDIHAVQVMVNAYMVYRQRCADRLVELNETVGRQRRLIKLLKKEYNLK
jgi:hypothetical protein